MRLRLRVVTASVLAAASATITAGVTVAHAAGPATATALTQDPVTTVVQAYLGTWAWLGPDAHGGPGEVLVCEIANAQAGA